MDIKKGNTDCVYFLASPLTCKKGMECEFRHSEVARLNPRDCYYWLAGNCLNPTCSFRHPPLERPETTSEPATVPQQSSVPATVPQQSSLPATVPQQSSFPATVPRHSSVLVNKVSVPCYFYFNGFCNKGDKCTFMHGPNDVSATPKVPKKTPVPVVNIHPPETKMYTESIKVQPAIEAPSNPVKCITSKSAVKVQFRPQEVASQPVKRKVLERSPSLQASLPGNEEEPVKSDTPRSAEDGGEQSPSPEQKRSGEQVEEEHIEREEWWESSPGLDVLVDNGLEEFEDDHEYEPVHDREGVRLHDYMLQREYKDSVGYDPMEYTGAEVMYVSGIHDVYVDLDEEKMFDYACGASKQLMDRDLDHVPYEMRKILPRKVEVKGRNDMDLRDELRRRKRLEGYQPYRNPRRYGPTSLEIKGKEHPRLHGMSQHPRPRQLASEVSRRTIGYGSQDRDISGVDRRSLLSLSETRRNNSRQYENENRRRPHFLPSEVSPKVPINRKKRGRPDTSTPDLFTGPKSLAQIKEEKMKPTEAGGGKRFENKRHRVTKTRSSVGDFEGPKPLNEILKEKKMSGSVNDSSNSPRSKQENNHHVGDERRDDEFVEKNWIESVIDEDEEDGYEDYYDGDDGGFEEKLANIYS
ncbi:hypothetical protein MKW98_014325 [Papaver atlanticum]|uniref:C3H1-type domain-containing protein n=1 Tax=Papaver atlanticum TaxID=357466 RepID=A0AAD4SP68_9MAGN|nr:hypothetical protein MKW98_014325 [Papaver atlanticum]